MICFIEQFSSCLSGTQALPKIDEYVSSPESNNLACDTVDQIPLEQGTSVENELEVDGHYSSEPETKLDSLKPGTNHVENGHNHVELGTKEPDNDTYMDVASVPCSTEVSSELELCSPVSVSTLCNVGDRQDITVYADSEWKGDTPRARLMREVTNFIYNGQGTNKFNKADSI
jgi:hypothetical protein